MTRAARALALSSLIALLFLCLAWELWAAPLRPGGSWLAVKGLPLLAPLPGVLAGRRYTYQWAILLALAYFIEGTMRAYADPPPSNAYALLEAVLATIFLASAVVYLRRTRRAPLTCGISTGSAK